MPDYGSPIVRRRRLAAELRRLRELSGRTGDQVADELGWSPSKVSRYELARTGLKPADVRKLLELYRVSPEHREELLALATEATRKGWWEAYSDILPEEFASLIGLEAEASSSWQWNVELVPGLLQTADYAREVNSGYQGVAAVPPVQMERRLRARLARQQVLNRDPPFELSVVLDESVLLRQLAEASVMRAQLEWLVETAARLPNVTLRIRPLGKRYTIMTGSFSLLRFGQARETTMPDVVYSEHLRSNLYFDDATDTYLYSLAFRRLVDESLEPSESLELISQTARRVWA
jgi:transcriptional regulator with XRE-family HTH domain